MTKKPEAVPDWAQNPLADKISGPQRSYIESMLTYKDLRDVDQVRIDGLDKALRISYDVEEIGLTKTKASEIITWLKGRPNLPRSEQQQAVSVTDVDFVPAGRYAVDSNEGELRFYQVWRPKDNQGIVQVYVLHGPDSSRIPGRAAEMSILEKIAKDIRGAAIRFGNEIGACSRCGRRLTNRVSRELGIGPICGGRMFEDGDWKSEVKAARARIVARGEDPDEEVEHEPEPTFDNAGYHGFER